MNGNKFLLDTNIVLYILNGDESLANFLNGEILYISIITEMELLSYKDITSNEKQQIEKFTSSFFIVNISNSIKDTTVKVKTASSLKLPDSIIAATSI